ncbi:MAG: ferritin-like domain-containing protein [Planctomycetota bacterium]|jgi:rubrerythrin
MNIYDYAMEKEKQAEGLYLELANKTSNKGFSNIFNMLAIEESNHYKLIEDMKNDVPMELLESELFPNAKKVFERMGQKKEEFVVETDQIEIYKKAQGIEQQSRDFYLEKANEAGDAFQAEVFEKLAEEEQRHYQLIGNIIEMVLRPEQWLENAEWHHIDEY